ncbi:hypothetical protein ACQJBY_071525 [Aegilops geniculata]
MGYSNHSSSALITLTCPGSVDLFLRNLTSSYADKSNESSVVATSVFMLVLAAVFFNLSLFSRVSNTSAVLKPTARHFLSAALSLFLPIMSYLLSQAKSYAEERHQKDLPVQARLILLWMLFVELLRKKVEAILVSGGMHKGYSGIISHATTVAWLGYLVFFNLKEAGQVAVFGTLWLICAAKFVQRVAFTEIGRRSLAHGKNARLLSSYMAQLLQAGRRGRPHAVQAPPQSERLEMCEYVVMGEENLVVKPGPLGYQLLSLDRVASDDKVVTVGKIWQHVESDHFKRLCLSFALFKQLRRRFEPLPAITKEETDLCRDLIFQDFCRDKGVVSDDSGVALFQLLKDEISFMSEYHHSVHPVVLASPCFLVANYIVFPVMVFVFCFMTLAISTKGDMLPAFRSIMVHNGIFTLTKCIWRNVLQIPTAFFSAIDISVSCLLFIAFVLEEVEEFLVIVLSNWFVVSLLCTYIAKPRRRLLCPTYSGTLHCISWVSSKLSHPGLITFKQVSVLSMSWLPMTLPTVALPTEAKGSIMKRFLSAVYGHEGSPAPFSKGQYILDGRWGHPDYLSWFCESDSIAEVILTWHIATSLLEMPYPQRHKEVASGPTNDRKVVVTRLSKYCAYLVAFHPELLPDDREGTECVYKDMNKDLKNALGCWNYYFAPESIRYEKMMKVIPKKPWPDCRDDNINVVQKGAMLGKALIEESKGNEGSPWELLAELWVELIVYIAPSSREEQVKGHEEALGQGGELLTLLWTLATHTGVTSPPPESVAVMPVEDRERLHHCV